VIEENASFRCTAKVNIFENIFSCYIGKMYICELLRVQNDKMLLFAVGDKYSLAI
jgi:hypothetical protein